MLLALSLIVINNNLHKEIYQLRIRFYSIMSKDKNI